MPKQAVRLTERPGDADTGTGDGLLISKIRPPAVPGWVVPRPRVEKLVADGVRRPLTVVTGPPGAGKTILVASWLAAGGEAGPAAWMSVDQYDNQPETFWPYLAEALRRGGAPVPPPGQACAQGESARHEFLLRLATALAGQDPPAVLVLDDIHLLTCHRTLDDLAYLLRYASAGLRLVITSRMDPLLPLHRFRLTGDLAEIRAADLAFTASEAGLLIRLHGISLSPAALAALTERNEGWAAGLRLAALSMRGHPDPDQFVKEFSAEDSAILGYLVDEVLDSEPARARDLLMKTSILDRVSDDLAGELTGDGQAPGVLPALAQANAFIQPLGHGWYRYHSLFADVLRLKLRREFPCDVGDLHRRAAGWFRRNGRLADAVGQAAAAGDWGLAARAVVDELAVGWLIEHTAGEPLARAFQRMPADPVPPQVPPLLVAAGMAVRDQRMEAAGSLLSAAQQRLQRLPAADEVPSRLAMAQIRLALARQAGDLALAEDSVAQAERALQDLPAGLLARHPGARAQVLAGRESVEAWRGHFDSVAALLGTAAATLDDAAAADPDGSAGDRAECLGQHALTEALRGRLGSAAGLAAAAATGGRIGLCPPSAAAGVALAWAHLEHDRLADCRSLLEQADHALRARPDKLVAALACLVAARLNVASGRPLVASDLVDRARRGWSPPSWLDRRLLLADSSAWAAAGDASRAVESARRAGPGPWAAVALARAWLTAGDPDAAGQALSMVPAAPARELPEPAALEACLAEAALRYRTGDRATGRRALGHALRLAEPEQLRLPFRLERAWLEPVLRQDPVLARSLRRLLAPGQGTPGAVTGGLRPAAPQRSGELAPVIVDRLSEREREVLECASWMLSTAEIADELYLSVNTVKSHLRSIFRKLGASRRGEAVRRARQLQLL